MKQSRLNSVYGVIPTVLGCVINSHQEVYDDISVVDVDSGSSTSATSPTSTSIQQKEPSSSLKVTTSTTTTTTTTEESLVPFNKSRNFHRFSYPFKVLKSNKDNNINHHKIGQKHEMFCPPPVREKYLKKYGKK